MSFLIKPYASHALKDLFIKHDEIAAVEQYAHSLPQVRLSQREVGDLIMLGMGAFTPLKGFMNYADWHSVCQHMQTSNGTFWPIPITLSTDEITADKLTIGEDVALIEPVNKTVIAILTLKEKYKIDKAFDCQQILKV